MKRVDIFMILWTVVLHSSSRSHGIVLLVKKCIVQNGYVLTKSKSYGNILTNTWMPDNHCLREIFKFCWYERREVFCSKVEKSKMKHCCFCLLWFSCCGSRLHLGFSWKTPWIFLTPSSQCMESVCLRKDWCPTLILEKTRDAVRLGALFLSLVSWVSKDEVTHSVLCSLKQISWLESLSRSAASRVIPPNKSACMGSIVSVLQFCTTCQWILLMCNKIGTCSFCLFMLLHVY